MNERICSNCHSAVPEGATFCTTCGNRLESTGSVVGAGDDATSIIPTGRGPSDATAVIPTMPPAGAASAPTSSDPNATVVGRVPSTPSGVDVDPPPRFGGADGPRAQPGYGQLAPPPPGYGPPQYPPPGPPGQGPPAAPVYGQPSYPPASAPPGQQWPGQQWPGQPWQGGPPPAQPWSSGVPAGATGRARAIGSVARLNGIAGTIGGLATIIGAFLPWARSAGEELDGWSISGDAKADVVLGISALVVGLVLALVAKGRLASILRLVLGGLGIAVLVTAIVDALDIGDKEADVRYGLAVVASGGLVMLVGALLPSRRR